jgi:hypothetical protein
MSENDVKEGVNFAPTRLAQAKMNSGFSFGECGLLKMSCCDLRNTVRIAPARQWILGIIKKDMWGGFFKLLGPVAGVQWFRRCDERKKVRSPCCLYSRRCSYFGSCGPCGCSHVEVANANRKYTFNFHVKRSDEKQ